MASTIEDSANVNLRNGDMERQAACWEYVRLPAAIIFSFVVSLFRLHPAFASKADRRDTQICSVLDIFLMKYNSEDYTAATLVHMCVLLLPKIPVEVTDLDVCIYQISRKQY